MLLQLQPAQTADWIGTLMNDSAGSKPRNVQLRHPCVSSVRAGQPAIVILPSIRLQMQGARQWGLGLGFRASTSDSGKAGYLGFFRAYLP